MNHRSKFFYEKIYFTQQSNRNEKNNHNHTDPELSKYRGTKQQQQAKHWYGNH